MTKILYKFFIYSIFFALVIGGPYDSFELLEQELFSFADFYNQDLILRSKAIFNVIASFPLLFPDISCFIALAVFRIASPVIAYPYLIAILFLLCLMAARIKGKNVRFKIRSALRYDLIITSSFKFNLILGFIAACQHYGSSCWLSAVFLGALIPLAAAKISRKLNLHCFFEDLN